MSIFGSDGVAVFWPACFRCGGLPGVVVVKVGTPHERASCFACATMDSPEPWEWMDVPHGEEA